PAAPAAPPAAAPPAAAPPAAAPPAAAPVSYPGKTLGIVGLILAFLAAIVGLIVSAIALSQSKKAGYKNTPALVGLIIGILGSIAWIIFWVVIGVTAATLGNACAELGPGVWDVDGVTYTCS
ncbi:MAG: hypothetical protein QM675_09740, partial [Protaetiibacter sp.]